MTQREKAFFSPTAVQDRLDALAEKFSFAKSLSLGKSLWGHTIQALSIGCGRKKLLFLGGHHGSEYLTSTLLCDFAEELCHVIDAGESRFGLSARSFLERRTLLLLPVVNPDGEEIALFGAKSGTPMGDKLIALNGGSRDFTHWQANARGVDINHNYDYKFAAYKLLEKENNITAGPTRFAGEFPESEPETLAVCRLVSEIAEDLSVLLTFHTQGEVIYYHNRPRTRGGAYFLSRVTGYRLAEAEGLASYGGLTDWANSLSIPAYTIEIGRGENPLPVVDRGFYYATLRELFFTSLLYF